jgi:ribosomal-protein-serine acetyltransferase
MDNFEDFFTATFETATLANSVVTLKGLRENSEGPTSADSILQAIEKSREHLSEHLPWIRDTDIFDIKKRIRSWVLNERFAQGGCWLIFKNTVDEISAGPASPMAGAIMMDVKLSNRSATLSYWLFKDYTGQGIMTEAVKLLSAYAFTTLKLNRLELLVSVHNDKSTAVAKRCGFKEEGICRDFELINGKFVDHRRFSLLARDVY